MKEIVHNKKKFKIKQTSISISRYRAKKKIQRDAANKLNTKN
jgi:hypothetical protein